MTSWKNPVTDANIFFLSNSAYYSGVLNDEGVMTSGSWESTGTEGSFTTVAPNLDACADLAEARRLEATRVSGLKLADGDVPLEYSLDNVKTGFGKFTFESGAFTGKMCL